LQRGAVDRVEEIDGDRFGPELAKLHRHRHDIGLRFAHPDDPAAANF
jgi:hypothetical protein